MFPGRRKDVQRHSLTQTARVPENAVYRFSRKGIFRLRVSIPKAIRNAPLKMTKALDSN